MEHLKNPKAIFFDLDETLVENVVPVQSLFKNIFEDFSNQIGEHQREAFFTHFRANIAGIWESMFLTEQSPESQLKDRFEATIASLSGFDKQQASSLSKEMLQQFVENSSNNVRPHSGVFTTLEALNSRGIITGIITNGIEQLQLGKIHRLGLHEQVHHVTVSAQARAHKPHQPVFELALKRAKVSAESAWQVGDHATNDVAGAIRAGMSGIFFNPTAADVEKAFSELKERPTHTIESIPQIMALLD